MEPAASDLNILTELNRNYVRSAEQSDVGWYAENLAEDFLASSVDGAQPEARDVRIRLLGEVALIHAGFGYTKPDGTAGSGRYTDVWARRAGRWVCVSAHFNRF